MEPPAEEAKGGAPEWMVTFADLMSLLLTFFVLLLSFSTTEVVKFQQMMGSIRDALGMRSEVAPLDSPSGENLLPSFKSGDAQGGPTREELEAELREVLEQTGAAQSGQAHVTKHGVVLQLSGDLMFESGRAEISPGARAVLDGLAEYVRDLDRGIDVIGHTDDVPIATAVFPSNWELSAARAGQAVRYLVEKGVDPSRLRAIGQAETAPLKPNDSGENRGANRRVEFVFTERTQAPEAAPEEERMSDLEAALPDLGAAEENSNE